MTISSSGNDSRRVAVLLTVYNGAGFLREQLGTLAGQTSGGIDVWASDDGSTDASPAILREAAQGWTGGTFNMLDGPRQGFAENFRFLMTRPEIDADYVAFCDQDDLWDADKLAHALSWLDGRDPDRPALYCSRTRSITIDGRAAGFSPLFPRPPCFRNAIVQSIAGANTMVMNRAAWRVVREASRRTGFVSHDWWCYLLVTGVGGEVHYSPEARIGYRQHAGNLVGENNSWRARFSRLRHLATGRFVRWNRANLDSLAACEDMLTDETMHTIRLFKEAREGPLFRRVSRLVRSGVYRQTTFGNAGLYVACVMKRL